MSEHRAIAHVAEGSLPVLVSEGFDRRKRVNGKSYTLVYCTVTAGTYRGRVIWVDQRMLSIPGTMAKRPASARRRDSRRKAQVLARQAAGSALAEGADASGKGTPVPTQVTDSASKPVVSTRLAEGTAWGTVACSCGNTWDAIGSTHSVSYCGQCSGE